jgi:hypothetical protein
VSASAGQRNAVSLEVILDSTTMYGI